MPRTADLLRQGLALDQAGRHDRAAEVYATILRREPGNADAMHLLGLALVDLGEAGRGRDLIARAVEAAPDKAIFALNYATVLAQLGEIERAIAYFRRAIELKPDYAEAWYGLSTNLKGRRDDGLLGAIEALLERGGLSGPDLSLLHFAAGKLADDIDEPDRAFRHYTQGNAAAARRFDREAHRRATADVLRVFTRDLFVRFKGAGSDSEAMVFVVGMPRSGTTLTEQILGRHPRVYAAGERRDIQVISRILPQQDPEARRFPDCVPHIRAEAFDAFAGRYLKLLGGTAGTAVRYVDKNPLNFALLGLIALMFPKSRIVHCRRDPVDTCLSCYFQYFRNDLDFAFDLGDLAAVYTDYRRLMDHWREHLPLPILDVDYESVVADPDAGSRRIVEFSGLPWDEACLSHAAGGRAVTTASSWQVRQPIYRSSVARADKYAPHLGPLLEGLAPCLDAGRWRGMREQQ